LLKVLILCGPVKKVVAHLLYILLHKKSLSSFYSLNKRRQFWPTDKKIAAVEIQRTRGVKLITALMAALEQVETSNRTLLLCGCAPITVMEFGLYAPRN